LCACVTLFVWIIYVLYWLQWCLSFLKSVVIWMECNCCCEE
jgi:hypothetical protein